MPSRSLLLLISMSLHALPTSAADVLRVLSWPGYVSAEAVRAFELRHKVSVELLVIASDEALWEQASASEGRKFDVLALNTAELARFRKAGLLQPLAPENISNRRQQLPRFRQLENIPGLSAEGKVWGIPFTWSAMGVIYDRKQVQAPPTGMSALWEARHRGHIALHNSASHAFSFTALSLGLSQPFQLSPEQFTRTLRRLISLRDNDPHFYSTPEELVELFRRQKVRLAFANYGDQQVQALQRAGLDVGYALPGEGALAWLDCWAILRGASDTRLAEAWINHMLTPDVSGQLTTDQGLANTLREPGSRKASDRNRLVWLEPVEDMPNRQRHWDRFLSGASNAPR